MTGTTRHLAGTARFPYAPSGWTQDDGKTVADEDGLIPTDNHWDMVRALQEYFARHKDDPKINSRELRDALDERFHQQGGLKFLYQLFPGGPISQGCLMAGLEPPAGSTDAGFGSVQ